jgi:hypothetical protein
MPGIQGEHHWNKSPQQSPNKTLHPTAYSLRSGRKIASHLLSAARRSVVLQSPTGADVYDSRVLCFEVHDHPADHWRQYLAFGAFGGEETPNALFLEALYLEVECALRDTNLFSPFRQGTSKEHRLSYTLVLLLLRLLEKRD